MSLISQALEHPELLSVLHALPDGVTFADADGRIVFSNEAADRILGTGATDGPPEEWAEHYGVFLPDGATPFPTEDYPLVRALEGETTRDVEMLIRRPDLDAEVVISASGRPFLESGGQVVGASVVFRDVTALRNAQHRLERAHADLLETQRLKEELTSFVVHDLKGPITNIVALTDILASEAVRDAAASARHAELIQEAAWRLHRMVLDLLDLQVHEDGTLGLALESVDVAGVLREVREGAAPRATLEGQMVLVEDVPAGLTVTADRSLLTRIVANLVDNSIKYAPPDSLIRLGARVREGAVELRVQDEGPGVPPDLREAVFEAYARGNRSDDRRAIESRGIGLRFCKVAVEAHGGSIRVEDAEPQGARFVVRLPADR